MSKQKINGAQKNKLLDLITDKPQLRTGKFSATFTHKDAQNQWEEIAEQLNAIPGAKKDWRAWRKTWQDYLSKTKAKSAAIKKVRRGTGGGPPPPNSLDDFEEGVAALLHPHAVSGHTGSSESTVTFDFEFPVPSIQHNFEVPLVHTWEPEYTQNLPQIIDDTILAPPFDFVGESGNEATSPQPTATMELEPPQTNNRQKKKKKVNMKTLLEEKVKIKKKIFEVKKKWYEAYIANMERQTRALEDISRAIQNFNNNNSITSSVHNNNNNSES